MSILCLFSSLISLRRQGKMRLFFADVKDVYTICLLMHPFLFACCARDGARLSAAIFHLALSDNVSASKVRAVTS
jgi:hypothetical protein